MKKTILAILSAIALASCVTSGIASATTISAEVGSRVDTVSNQYTRVTEARLQSDALGVQLTNSGTIGRVEVDYALTPIPFVGMFQVVVGAGVVTGADTIGHYTYSIQPKVTVPIGEKFEVSAGYKLRDDTQSSIKDYTRTTSIGLGYKVTKSVSIITKYESSTGDYRYKQATVGAAYMF